MGPGDDIGLRLFYRLHQGVDEYFNLEAFVAALLTSIGEYDVSEYL